MMAYNSWIYLLCVIFCLVYCLISVHICEACNLTCMLPVICIDQLCLQVKKYRILFLRFTHEDPKAQKYLLGGIEQVIALHKDALLRKVPGIFKVITLLTVHFYSENPFNFSKSKLRKSSGEKVLYGFFVT
jgi:hypothetical protein